MRLWAPDCNRFRRPKAGRHLSQQHPQGQPHAGLRCMPGDQVHGQEAQPECQGLLRAGASEPRQHGHHVPPGALPLQRQHHRARTQLPQHCWWLAAPGLRNVAGMADINSVQLARADSGNWIPMNNTFGANWELSKLPFPPLDLRISTKSGQSVVLSNLSCCYNCTLLLVFRKDLSLKDITAVRGAQLPSAGGSAANVMKGLANISAGSVHCKFMGMVGTDAVAQDYMQKLKQQNVQPVLLESCEGPTASCLCFVTPDGQRTMRTCLGASAHLTSSSMLPAGWAAGAALLHCEGYCLYRPQLALEAMREAQRQGALVSIDLASFECVANCKQPLLELLQGGLIDLVFANEEEAVALLEVVSAPGGAAVGAAAAAGDAAAQVQAAQEYVLQHAQPTMLCMLVHLSNWLIADPSYTVSGARDHYKQQGSGGFLIEKVPEHANLFSELQHHPTSTFRIAANDKVPAFIDRSFHPHQRQLGQLRQQSLAQQVNGTQQYKYFRRPQPPPGARLSAPLHLTQQQQPVAEPPAAPEPAIKDACTQSDYRESEAQTLPWSPDWVLPSDPAALAKQAVLSAKFNCLGPEVLQLADLKFGDGLPGGLQEVQRLEKLRQKRAFEASLPAIDDAARLPQRQALIEAWEAAEWSDREGEIKGVQEERLALLQAALKGQFPDAIKPSAAAGPAAMAAGNTAGAHARELPNIQSLAPSSQAGLQELQASLPARALQPKLHRPKPPAKLNYSQRAEAAVQQDVETISSLLQRAKAIHGRGVGQVWPYPIDHTALNGSCCSGSGVGGRLGSGRRSVGVAAALSAHGDSVAQQQQHIAGVNAPADSSKPPFTTGTDGQHAALVLLQRLLRGRAAQNEMYAGKTARLQLVRELRLGLEGTAGHLPRPEVRDAATQEFDAAIGAAVCSVCCLLASDDEAAIKQLLLGVVERQQQQQRREAQLDPQWLEPAEEPEQQQASNPELTTGSAAQRHLQHSPDCLAGQQTRQHQAPDVHKKMEMRQAASSAGDAAGEAVLGYDEEAHLRMQLVICKVRRCQALMQQYLLDIGSSARLLYTGPGWPQFDPLPQAEMPALLLSHALHVMPSEREGYGHSINEGRAAGAVLLVPDHPPMNELVPQGAGVLMRPAAVFSHADDPVPVLGRYGNISVSMSPQLRTPGMAKQSLH
ncbi:solute carrier, TRAMD3 or PAT1-domain-containing protein [Scenedesmus sp. NREL 46B-D3]|nr:solute carrier, TRAMD3 or PAT1-domain-containing protein [Scenedesmus sp. NREL 46B-D3]